MILNADFFMSIAVNDGLIQTCASEQKTFGKMLNKMCGMVLDYGLHRDAGVFIKLVGKKYFLN